MEFKLRPYQEKGAKDVAKMLAAGKRKVLFQLATGGGKTATFSAITKRYIEKSKKRVLIVVHREELLNQTISTLKKFCAINAAPIRSGVKKAPIAMCYVGMSETVDRRLKRYPDFFGEIGLLIIDEAHLGTHFKIFDHFPASYIVGFSATPLSARKDKPLNRYFDDIVCGIDIPQLIKNGSLCQNVTYSIRGSFDRKNAKVSKGEFAEKEMAAEFKGHRSVRNTIIGYEKHLLGRKCVVFNVNVSHSELVTQTFIDSGYNARHLDASAGFEYRKECLEWLNKTPDAILNNVSILTTGFDEPSIEGIIMNKATLSMPLWIQIAGRGARTFPGKEFFTIVDLGGNARTFGDWSDDDRDWADIFRNPPTKKEGVASVKDCPQCERILKIQEMICPECGYEFERQLSEQKIDKLAPIFEIVTKGVDVSELIEKHKDKKIHYPFFQMGRSLALQFRSAYAGNKFDDTAAERLLQAYHAKAKEWCRANNKHFTHWYKEKAKENLFNYLQTLYPSWQPSNQQ